ncbi:MAG: MATE family efflux transporter [Betaproteobacteria bacterium]|nr:MATE family efflux transporter [Betaproteobacteria bacterium]
MKNDTERLLSAPIVPTLLRLSAPGILLVLFQSMVSVGDTYFVGRLGTEPLAGVALVFPLLMLLQMTSAGAMGGGVSSAIARSLGRGDARTARRLVVHALVIACGMGLAFTALVLVFGRAIFRLLGGDEATIAQALSYSTIVFTGALAVWIANTLSSVLRGTGNMVVPAVALIGAACIHVPLSGSLVLGVGPLPKLGIAGAAVAYVSTFTLAALCMGAFVFRRASTLRPRAGDWKLERALFRDILRVGAISMLSSLQTVLTAVVLTGFVGRYGTAALAGYGVGLRLELLQVPLVFAVGQALVVLVGTHIGAGRVARAKRIAWTGAVLAASISLAIGAAAALFPEGWVGLFSDDAAVHAAGTLYLRLVALFFPFLGAGITLYFASQGAGQVLWPIIAGTARLAIVVAGGALAASLAGIFVVIAGAMVAYGVLTVAFIARAPWGKELAQESR